MSDVGCAAETLCGLIDKYDDEVVDKFIDELPFLFEGNQINYNFVKGLDDQDPIGKLYKRMARIIHPDKSDDNKEERTKDFQDLNNAVVTLRSNPGAFNLLCSKLLLARPPLSSLRESTSSTENVAVARAPVFKTESCNLYNENKEKYTATTCRQEQTKRQKKNSGDVEIPLTIDETDKDENDSERAMKIFIDAYYDFFSKTTALETGGEIDPYFFAKGRVEKNTQNRMTVLPFNGEPIYETGFNGRVELNVSESLKNRSYEEMTNAAITNKAMTKDELSIQFREKFDVVPLCGPIRGATGDQKAEQVVSNDDRGRKISAVKSAKRSQSAPTGYGRRLVEERFKYTPGPRSGKTIGGGSKTRKKRKRNQKQTKRKQRRGRKTRRK